MTSTRTRKLVAGVLSTALMITTLVFVPPGMFSASAATAWPLKVSANNRYLVDQTNKSFLFVGDTAWNLFGMSQADAEKVIDARKAQGFTAIQVSILGFERSSNGGLQGGDLTKPNESYFAKADAIIKYAQQKDMAMLVGLLWTRSNSGVSESAGTTFATWIGNRWKSQGNLLYFVGGDDAAGTQQGLNNAMGRALKAAHPGALITYHSWETRVPTQQDYIAFNSVQAGCTNFGDYINAIKDGYSKGKPILNMEPAYEDNDPSRCGGSGNINAAGMRKAAWHSMLSGALGVAYGGPPGTWDAKTYNAGAINKPGATQVGHVNRILSPLAWEKLVPDSGTVTGGSAVSGVASDGSLIVSYGTGSRSVNLSKLSGSATAQMYSAESGQPVGAAETVSNSGSKSFSSSGDGILVIKTTAGGVTPTSTPATSAPATTAPSGTTPTTKPTTPTTVPGGEEPGDGPAVTAQIVSNNAIAVRGEGFVGAAKADVKFAFGTTIVSRSVDVDSFNRLAAIALIPAEFTGDVTVTVTAGATVVTKKVTVGTSSNTTASPTTVPGTSPTTKPPTTSPTTKPPTSSTSPTSVPGTTPTTKKPTPTTQPPSGEEPDPDRLQKTIERLQKVIQALQNFFKALFSLFGLLW